MLVTFHSKAYADITMFGDVALGLLKAMGLSGAVPSALLAEDVPAALARLQTDLQRAEQVPPPRAAGEEDSEEEQEAPVTLAHRALPLIALLEASAKARCDVMWD